MRRRSHHPACDSQLGPDFEVRKGEVVMSIFACVNFECWDQFEPVSEPCGDACPFLGCPGCRYGGTEAPSGAGEGEWLKTGVQARKSDESGSRGQG